MFQQLKKGDVHNGLYEATLKHQCFATEKPHLKNIFKYQIQIYLSWNGKSMVIITGHKKHFLPKYWNRPSPHDTCGGRAPPTLRFSLQKKNVHLCQSSRSVSCCAWPREQPEHDTEKLLVHLTDSAGPAQQNPAPLELLHLTCCRARGCCETGWASLTNQGLGPPWGTAESSIWHHSQGCWGAALSEVTVGQEQPCTEPSTGTLQWLCSWTSREKLTLGSHWLLHTLWQCHLPAGAAGTFRMHQLLRKTSRDVNGSGEKSMQKVTPKISSI